MNPDPSPLAVAAYVVGLVLTVPALVAIVKVIYFVAAANAKLDRCVDGVTNLEGRLATLNDHETRLTLVERDVDQLKDSAA